jgi:hypothetical protein
MRDTKVSFDDLREPEARARIGSKIIDIHRSAVYTEAIFGDFDAHSELEWLVVLLRTGKLPNAE